MNERLLSSRASPPLRYKRSFLSRVYLRRLLRVRKEALAVCVGRRQDFINSPAERAFADCSEGIAAFTLASSPHPMRKPPLLPVPLQITRANFFPVPRARYRNAGLHGVRQLRGNAGSDPIGEENHSPLGKPDPQGGSEFYHRQRGRDFVGAAREPPAPLRYYRHSGLELE